MKSDGNTRLSVKDIAVEIDSPVSFTAKILQQLARKKIIASTRGLNGGFYIEPNTKPITIYQVVEAIDGVEFFDRCVMGLKKCSDKNPCPMHIHFVNHRNEIKTLLMSKSINDLIVQQNGKINLK